MKKKLFITFIILLSLIVLGVVIFMLHPLSKSEEQIREQLLQATPLGTHMEDVIEYVESNRKWEVVTISREYGFRQRGTLNRVGEKSIHVDIGEYRIIFSTGVEAFWGFDENSELIGIRVRKTIDAL